MAMNGSVTPAATQNPITAVDIVLEPDATMIQQAQAANAGLLKNFPKGYTLGDEHAPHMSVIGGYFHTANVDEVFARRKQGIGRREGDEMEVDGVQVLLHRFEGDWAWRHSGSADTRPDQVAG
jgi:hypothetical protein